MKIVIKVLLFMLLLIVAAGSLWIQDDEVMNKYYNAFPVAVNIISPPGKADSNMKKLETLADEHDISFMKEYRVPRNERDSQQEINVYIYLHDVEWLKKELKALSFTEDSDGVNRFGKEIYTSFLTFKTIKNLPFSSMNPNLITGDYHFYGEKEDVDKFIEVLNSDASMGMQAVVDDSFECVRDISASQWNLYIMILFVMIAFVLFGCVIHNAEITKELASARLLGWTKSAFAATRTKSLVTIPSLAALLAACVAVFLVSRPGTITGYVSACIPVIVAMLLCLAAFTMTEYLLLYRKASKFNIGLALKGERPNHEFMSSMIKGLVCVAAILMIAIATSGLQDYKELKTHIPAWEQTKQYVNIACSWPWEYVRDDEKFLEVVNPKLEALSDSLEKEGAILFKAPNADREGMQETQSEAEDELFDGKYAYINTNYLDVNPIYDSKGNRISVSALEKGKWIVLYPENREPSHEDKKEMAEVHTYYSLNNTKDRSEEYVPVKKGQSTFTFDSRIKLDSPDVKDYTLIVVNLQEYEPKTEAKAGMLVNGELHPKVNNPEHAYEELKGIITATESEPYTLWISSIYSDVQTQIDLIKKEALVNTVALVMLLLILAVTVRADVESYLYHHGKRIDVAHLLGHRLWDVHKMKMVKSVVIFTISLALFAILLKIYPHVNYLGLHTPRDGWTTEKMAVVMVMGLGLVLMSLSAEMIKIYRNKRSISERLKEGN